MPGTENDPESGSELDRLNEMHARARTYLDTAGRTTAVQFVESLTEARNVLDEALSEAMAQAVTSGNSVRQVADAAGLAPNSVSARLAHSTTLSGYADDDGRVRASGVVRARHAARTDPGPKPMRFTPRRSTPDPTDAQEG